MKVINSEEGPCWEEAKHKAQDCPQEKHFKVRVWSMCLATENLSSKIQPEKNRFILKVIVCYTTITIIMYTAVNYWE